MIKEPAERPPEIRRTRLARHDGCVRQARRTSQGAGRGQAQRALRQLRLSFRGAIETRNPNASALSERRFTIDTAEFETLNVRFRLFSETGICNFRQAPWWDHPTVVHSNIVRTIYNVSHAQRSDLHRSPRRQAPRRIAPARRSALRPVPGAAPRRRRNRTASPGGRRRGVDLEADAERDRGVDGCAGARRGVGPRRSERGPFGGE